MNIILGALTFTGLIDILPIVCAIIFCITILAKKEQNIRKLMIVNQILWLIFDIIVGAYFFVISNVLTIISTGIAIYRFNKKGSKK